MAKQDETKDELLAKKKAELEEEAQQLDLETAGTKAELADRIEEKKHERQPDAIHARFDPANPSN